jgi:hypothetical protein
MSDRVYNVLNLGAGWQSSRILLGACRGEFPKFDAAVFADTQWEPKAVYRNLEFLREETDKAGIPLVCRTSGNIREEAIQSKRLRGESGGRFAAMPLFVKNLSGSAGRMPRQCTKEYKIEVVDLWVRRELLGIASGSRIPKGVEVRYWFGISDDEASRAVFPGVFRTKTKVCVDLYGEPFKVKTKRWFPCPWRMHCYPLLNEIWRPERRIEECQFLPRREQREDCGEWLATNYPGRTFPRSACIGCPFRSNEEWRDMRDNRPEEWEDACDFDEAQRVADHVGQVRRGLLVGEPYVHRQLVPLRMADLSIGGNRETRGGCGTLYDGQDGLCNT